MTIQRASKGDFVKVTFIDHCLSSDPEDEMLCYASGEVFSIGPKKLTLRTWEAPTDKKGDSNDEYTIISIPSVMNIDVMKKTFSYNPNEEV